MGKHTIRPAKVPVAYDVFMNGVYVTTFPAQPEGPKRWERLSFGAAIDKASRYFRRSGDGSGNE